MNWSLEALETELRADCGAERTNTILRTLQRAAPRTIRGNRMSIPRHGGSNYEGVPAAITDLGARIRRMRSDSRSDDERLRAAIRPVAPPAGADPVTPRGLSTGIRPEDAGAPAPIDIGARIRQQRAGGVQ